MAPILELINYLDYSSHLVQKIYHLVWESNQVCVIRNFPLDDAALEGFSNSFGQPLLEARNQNGGAIGYVQVKGMDIPTYANTPHDFPCHTDCSDFLHPPELVFLLCVQPAREGGDSLIVNLNEVIESINSEDRKQLARPQFLFKDTKYPILDTVEGSTTIRYNRVMLEISRRLRNAPIDEQYELLNRFDQLLKNHQKVFKLVKGDCLVINNQKTLHGRFKFKSEERLLKRVRVVVAP